MENTTPAGTGASTPVEQGLRSELSLLDAAALSATGDINGLGPATVLEGAE